MNIGLVIKALRKKKGLKQYALAERVGVSTAYLSQIEKGKRDASLQILRDISECLDVPLPVIHFMSLSSDEVSPEKKQLFELLRPSVISLIQQVFEIDDANIQTDKVA